MFDDDRNFDVEVDYAKGTPEDILIRIRATNRGPEAAALYVLPTLWLRNTWSWTGSEPAGRFEIERRSRGRRYESTTVLAKELPEEHREFAELIRGSGRRA